MLEEMVPLLEVNLPLLLFNTSFADHHLVKGAVVPGPGANKVTEPDTTVFKGANADGCGQTKGVSTIVGHKEI